jgi:hypothetical protein
MNIDNPTKEMRLLALLKRYGEQTYCQGSFAALDNDKMSVMFFNLAAEVKREFIKLLEVIK